MKTIFILLSAFCTSLSVFAQFDVVITADGVVSGKIQIKNDENKGAAFTGTTNGEGVGVVGANTALSGIRIGVMGISTSNTNGNGNNSGVSGVLGQIPSTAPGSYSAGVRGVNNGTGFEGAGVIGYHAGAGRGVIGQSFSGLGVYGYATNPDYIGVGVRGETLGKYGAGVEAMYSGTGVGTALKIINGAIKVEGTNKAAFIHTAATANITSNSTTIDNPMCNDEPGCMLFITQYTNYETPVYNNSSIGTAYNYAKHKWIIFNESGAAMPNNAMFNVLVIKL